MTAKRRPPPIHMFLPPETVEMVMHYGSDFPPDLAFEEQMTVLFSDMRGFTELADQYRPREVYAAINASIALQTKLVRAHGGSVNKFLGDGLLACFSGEDHIPRAFACVLEMLRILPEQEGQRLPCRVGFGLHTGKVLFGILGDEERREFTVIGDVANTAARLCGLAGPFQALFTHEVLVALPEDTRKQFCERVGSQLMRGKKEPIEIYRICLPTAG